MTAKEYFKKYEQRIMSTTDDADYTKAASEIMLDMIKESKEILDLRHIKTDAGLISVIKELNQKWNAICNLFEKKHGVSPLIRNGYKKYWISQMPELTNLL